MKKILLLFMAMFAYSTIFANEVYFYFQDGEEDDFELEAPQTLVSIWNETDEEPVAVPEDMAFMNYSFEGAKILRISPSDFDYELVVAAEGDADSYFLEKEETEWYLTLLPEANDLEIYVRVYLAGQAPGGEEPSNVMMNFNIQAADGSGIANPGELVEISYFDINLFKTVTLPIEDNYASASVAPGAAFEIVPKEGYVVTEVMTYLEGMATVSEPGEDEDIWRLAVSYEPESDFASYFITVDKKETEGPSDNPAMATITQIEPLQWKVEWTGYSYISRTDTDYFENNAFLTDSKGDVITLYSNVHDSHENPEIVFPAEYGNYFTVNLNSLKLAEGTYALTIPAGYVELGSERLRSEEQNFDLEVGKTPEVSYTVQFSEVFDNYFDISWENVTSLTAANTEGAYMRNVMSNEEYPLVFLHDELYSKCQIRIYNDNKLRVNFTNNYPDLPSGMYELYLPAGYVKFNGTDKSNEAIEGHMFTYTQPWQEGEVEFNALLNEKKLVLTWVDASAIAYNTAYEGDGHNIKGLTIFDSSDYQYNLVYNEDFTISGNTLTIDISGMNLADGECTLLVPEDCLLITVDGVTDYTYGLSQRFNYGNSDQPDAPKLYDGEATWSIHGDDASDGIIVEVNWDNHKLALTDDPENCSVHNPETGVIELYYGSEVNLSADKTSLMINLGDLPENIYRVNVPEACLYIYVDEEVYLNGGTSMDGITSVVAAFDARQSHYTVVNLNGIVVLSTENAADLYKLPHGIYVINGKLHIVK